MSFLILALVWDCFMGDNGFIVSVIFLDWDIFTPSSRLRCPKGLLNSMALGGCNYGTFKAFSLNQTLYRLLSHILHLLGNNN
jgi:hypothetical protein